jgi:hypothetical protein
VDAVMNLRIPQNAENFLSSWGHVSFQQCICFVELVRVAVVGWWRRRFVQGYVQNSQC